MIKYGYVYILASKGKRLYIGITTRLEHRVWQHKTKANPECFTARYNINQLVYFERHPLITAAIAREKELKGWLRIRKIALIVANNPTWKDLSLEWGQPIGPLKWTRPPSQTSDTQAAPSNCRHPERSEGSPHSSKLPRQPCGPSNPVQE